MFRFYFAVVCFLFLPCLILAQQPAHADDEAVKAIISALTRDLKSKKVADRIKAANALGELRKKGKPASRALCDALLGVCLSNQPPDSAAATGHLSVVRA